LTSACASFQVARSKGPSGRAKTGVGEKKNGKKGDQKKSRRRAAESRRRRDETLNDKSDKTLKI
jgi:hypothetical protein